MQSRTLRYSAYALLVIAAVLALAGAAQATWTDTLTGPTSFKPGREVTFTFTASSNSAADTQTSWAISFRGCRDANGDNQCQNSEPRYHADVIPDPPGNLVVAGGASGSKAFTVTFADPEEDDLLVHVFVGCTTTANGVCVGSRPPPPPCGQADTCAYRQTLVDVRYTNTWTRDLLFTSPVKHGTTQNVQYRLTSTSVNDRDLTGTANLYSTPPGKPERDEGAKSVPCTANTVCTFTWTNVLFEGPGLLKEEVRGTNFAAPYAEHVEVRDVHNHQDPTDRKPPEGTTVGILVLIEGHGATTVPRAGVAVTTTYKVDGVEVLTKTGTTDATGRAYWTVQFGSGVLDVDWTSTATTTWDGTSYTATANGHLEFEAVSTRAIQENVTALRADVREIKTAGVGLSTEGLSNLLNHGVRALAAFVIFAAVVAVVFVTATRI